eukprot:s659_g31.t1
MSSASRPTRRIHAQAIQTFGRIADQYHFSSGVLFLDLANAFHRLVREWITGVQVPEDLQAVLQSLRDEDSCAGIQLQDFQWPCLLEQLGAPGFLVVIGSLEDGEAEALIEDAYADLVFLLPRQTLLIQLAHAKAVVSRLEREGTLPCALWVCQAT